MITYQLFDFLTGDIIYIDRLPIPLLGMLKLIVVIGLNGLGTFCESRNSRGIALFSTRVGAPVSTTP